MPSMTIGRIIKPQGIRGEVKVETSDSSRFCVLKSVTVGEKPYKISSARISGAFAYIKLVGVDDRNSAEALRGKTIEVDRAVLPPLGDGEFYVDDVIGTTLTARGSGDDEAIGKIVRVDSFGAADVFSVECADGGSLSFAFTKDLDAQFDAERKVFSVRSDKLAEVAVHDD